MEKFLSTFLSRKSYHKEVIEEDDNPNNQPNGLSSSFGLSFRYPSLLIVVAKVLVATYLRNLNRV